MAFFLGLSVVSILECFCYCCVSIGRKCCEDNDDEEDRERWKQNMNNEIDDKDIARERAAARQREFNEMESRLRRMDARY